MADFLPFYKALEEIADLMLDETPAINFGRSTETVADVSCTAAREIIKAVLQFAVGQVAEAGDSGEAVCTAVEDYLWPGDVAGLSLSAKLRDSSLSLPDFFKYLTKIKSHFIERLCQASLEPDQFRQGLICLDAFFSSFLAGFVQGYLRLIKRNFRRRQQEAKLYILKEKKRYSTIFSQMNDPAFVVDYNLRLIDVNPACENFFKTSKAELIGASCCEIIGKEFCKSCPLEKVVANGGSFSNVEVLTTLAAERGADPGENKTILMAGTALGDLNDGNKGGIFIFQDITEQKKTVDELGEYRSWLEDLVDERTEDLLGANEKLQKEIADRRHVEKELIEVTASLKRSNAELEQFAHVACHDLQEPLMLVASFAERLMLRYASSLDEPGREYLARIMKATRKLQDLVDALLQLSKVSTSTVRFDTLDMNELVQDVMDDLEEIINRSGARIDIGVLPELNGDAVQIRQLFQNLLSNALKYHRENEVPSISIRSQMIDDICEITVEDCGVGFSEGDIEKIFEPFVRLHGRDAYEGTGMGLTSCKKIVDRHGGEIIARTKPECGAVFVVRLPLRQEE